MPKIVLASGLLCALAGCDLPPLPTSPPVAVAPTTYHDVAYYDIHTVERTQTRAWCSDNPGLASKSPSCDSANTSARHARYHAMGVPTDVR
jgi:hypothetical protein